MKFDNKMSKEKKLNPRFFAALIVLLFLFAHAGYSQTGDTTSLNKCIEIAVKNNQSLQNKRLDELINQAKIDETKADLYPQVKFKGSYQYYPTVPTSLIEASAFGGPAGKYSASQLLVPQSITGSIDISLQVYNPAILAALKISKFSKMMGETATKDKLEAVTYDVSATYLNIQVNALQTELTRSNIANLKRNLDLTTLIFSQGLALRSDVDNLTLSVANLETVLNNQLNGINQLYNLLKMYMDLPPDYPLSIETYKKEEMDYAFLTGIDTITYKNRSGYTSVQQAGDLLMLQRESIKAGYLPSVNLIGSFGYTGFNPDFKPFQAYNNRWYATNLIQLNLEVPIYDGMKKRKQLVQNNLQQQQNFNSLKSLKNTFQMEQVNALNNYNLYVKDFEYQTKNIGLANKLYNQKLLEYKNANASLNDMITVENTVKTAQSNYLNALIKLKIAELDIKKANGQLIKKQ
jgi:outer membrane protein